MVCYPCGNRDDIIAALPVMLIRRRSCPPRSQPSFLGKAAPIPPRWRMRWLSPRAQERSARASAAARQTWAAVQLETPEQLRAALPYDARPAPCRAALRRRWTSRADDEAARHKALRRPQSRIRGFVWFAPFTDVSPASAPKPPGRAGRQTVARRMLVQTTWLTPSAARIAP